MGLDDLGLTEEQKAKIQALIGEEWWIATNFFRLGGKKVLGPFKTKELALSVRELLEKSEVSKRTYAVDITKRFKGKS
jgi:hypothetical protein